MHHAWHAMCFKRVMCSSASSLSCMRACVIISTAVNARQKTTRQSEARPRSVVILSAPAAEVPSLAALTTFEQVSAVSLAQFVPAAVCRMESSLFAMSQTLATPQTPMTSSPIALVRIPRFLIDPGPADQYQMITQYPTTFPEVSGKGSGVNGQ